MEMNAWWVAKELSYRIDGAPVFSEYIHCSVTEYPSDAFFFYNEHLKQFQKGTDGTKKETPGYFYIMKILKFIEEHYRVGDLYMEYIKDGLKIDSLTKSELQHYLKNFKLSCQGKKSDWIERIATHLTLHGNLCSNQSTAPMTFSINISNTSSIANFENDFSTDADSDSDEDEVLAVGSGSDEGYLEDQDQDFYISDHTTTHGLVE